MSGLEQRIREWAYRLWEEAGRPHGRSEEFWFAARNEIEGDAATGDAPPGMMTPLGEEPPVVAAQHGVPAGMPGERIVEQGVIDDRLEELGLPDPMRTLAD